MTITDSPVAPARAPNPYADTCVAFEPAPGKRGLLYSLPALGRQLGRDLQRLPLSIRIVLESLLRHCDGQRVLSEQVAQLAAWQPKAPRNAEIPFVVARVVLQDFTGVPLLADLAAMRHAAQLLGKPASAIEPLVPVDLVVDHSVMIDHWGNQQALDLNMALEFQRNHERYGFMKWGMQAFGSFGVVPPGFGIVHQVNLEYLARGVHRTDKARGATQLYYPDTLVGTDSHTTMINGIGVVGWGVGGIEAEAAMLGQPVTLLTPDVVGVELSGRLREGVTATDLVLTITELLRREKVVGQFVEFFGKGTETLALPDRATIANMAPEFGATLALFPVDDKTVAYLKGTGRRREEVAAFESYFKAQGLFGVPRAGQIDYSRVIPLDLGRVTPSLAGPKRPQDRIELGQVARQFDTLFSAPASANGYQQPPERLAITAPAGPGLDLHHGDVLIAAITSCTNTSNPGVMLAAGLLAKKAVARGLTVAPHIKTSLAPGSRIVTDYLEKAGLAKPLRKLGFFVSAYGCTTCIGNAGDLAPGINQAINEHDLVCAAVLSGNRNFEARIHPNLKANFLASPPLVVAYAIAGTMRRDLMTEPLGHDPQGQPVFLGDVWPSSEEIHALMKHALDPGVYRSNYQQVSARPGKLWKAIEGASGPVYDWPASSYIARPPFFDGFVMTPPAQVSGVSGARILALFGDSITTDHISPAGNIAADSPAGRWLQAQGVAPVDFNSYGARRGHHEVMVRGTFANVRIKNQMLPPRADGRAVEGGCTRLQQADGRPGPVLSIYDAAMSCIAAGTPTVVFAGEEYGTGSSRDWAAKGTRLLGIRAVVARSFERIHRSNLVGMGVLPLQFQGSDSWQSLGLTGDERVDIVIDGPLAPQREAQLVVHHTDGRVQTLSLELRIDTPIEVDYFRHGGILPFVLRQLLAA
jgi:aconitate hydratase